MLLCYYKEKNKEVKECTQAILHPKNDNEIPQFGIRIVHKKLVVSQIFCTYIGDLQQVTNIFDMTTDSVINSGKYLCDNIYDDFIDLKINSREFIDEIAFDPRLSKGDFEDWKTMLSYLSGNIPIVQSDLYEFQPISMSLKRSPYHINL